MKNCRSQQCLSLDGVTDAKYSCTVSESSSSLQASRSWAVAWRDEGAGDFGVLDRDGEAGAAEVEAVMVGDVAVMVEVIRLGVAVVVDVSLDVAVVMDDVLLSPLLFCL